MLANQLKSAPPALRSPQRIGRSKKQALESERFRNAIEGKFGQAKRRYSLNRIMEKLSETAETSIAITFLVINLSTLLRQVNCLFLSLFLYRYKLGFIMGFLIKKADIKVCFYPEKLIFKPS